VLALVLFGWLANDVMRGEKLRFDGFVREALHARASPSLTAFMRGVTQLGSPTFLLSMTALLAGVLAYIRRRRATIVLVIAVGGGVALDELLKLLFHRPRPEAFFDYPLPTTFSFPSGHAVSSACFYGVAAAVLTARIQSRYQKAVVWAAAGLMAALIGVSRIYLGVHYPSDVVAGYCAAILWVSALGWSYRRWADARTNHPPHRPNS
jgi:undecaprenyl-diphosphatase